MIQWLSEFSNNWLIIFETYQNFFKFVYVR